MNAFPNKEDTGGTTPAPPNRRMLVNKLVGVALLAALAAAIGISFTPKPAVQVDAEAAAVQAGVTAFKAGAFGTARADLEPPAKKGNPQAAYWLGEMYDDGLGVKKDADTAISWFRAAAEGGWPDAAYRLGEIYFNGTEELQDFKKARKWLEQAARNGYARAQTDLGQLYAKGWGGKKDPIQAYVWYEFAAKQGDFEAQRLRDGLLKIMPDGDIAKAQNLTEKMAPKVFGQDRNRGVDKKAPDARISR